jgi:glycosyltransferase involved in cell wall biosynthesis
LLRRAGVPRQILRCIPPPAPNVDLPLPQTPFTVGFASWPFEADEAEARGLDLLRGAAAALPRVCFRILLRPGSKVPAHAFRSLPNVTLIDDVLADATSMWGPMHALLAPFRSGSKAKSVPNSILEALGAGRPVIVSTAIGIAAEIEQAGAGLSIAPRLDDLCAAIRGLEPELVRHAKAARRFAEAYTPHRFQSAYAELTSALLTR